MNLKSLIANRVRVGGYQFEKDTWTPVEETDYFLSEWCPYVLIEEKPLGGYWLRYVGDARSVSYYSTSGIKKRLKCSFGDVICVERAEAVQLRRMGFEWLTLAEVPSDDILVVRDGGLGDILMVLPSIAKLEVDVTFLTREAFLYPVSFVSNAVSSVDRRYDGVVDLRRWVEGHSDSNNTHRIKLFAERFGVEPDIRWQLPYKRESGDYVVVQAGGASPRRSLPKERVVELCGLIPASVVLVDNIEFGFEGKLPDNVVDKTGALTVEGLFDEVSGARCVVSGDSGLFHVAEVLGVPVVGLFGPVDDSLRARGLETTTILRAWEFGGCKPCNDKPCREESECLSRIPTCKIVEEVSKWL